MNKNQLIIEDYDIFDTELSVYFSVNQELDVREGRIDLDEFDVWLNRNGLYEMSRDCWDYAQESHYTEDWEIGFGEYLSDYICTDDVRDFVVDYYENKTLPDFVEE
jgi:hypothetical protein